METAEEPWELFDFEADLQVTISEDGKEYLRQFGLEQYDFENYTPDEDPGKYFTDVPLDQNPEALFDLLTRESFRDQSSDSPRCPSVTAPPRQAPHRSSARHGTPKHRHHDDTGSTSRRQAADVSPTYHSIGEDAFPTKTTTPPKRVSFTQTATTSNGSNKENIIRKPRVEGDGGSIKGDGARASRHSRTMTSFFGRPKVKGSKSKREEVVAGKGDAAHRREEVEGDAGGEHAQEDPQSGTAKKSRKFKFPVLDLMSRTRRNAGNHSSKQTTAAKPEVDSPPLPRGGATDNSGGSTSSPPDPRVVGTPPGGGVLDRLDILQGSPELGATERDISGSGGGRLVTLSGGVSASSLSSSDADSYMFEIPTSVQTTNSHLPRDDPPPIVPARFQEGATVAVGAEDAGVNIVEIVSCQLPEVSMEVAPGRGGEHLPPGLLAAVTGDINLLKESVAHLSLDSLDKLRDAAGNTVLHACAAAGHLQCVEYVCKHCPLLAAMENKAHLTPTAMAIKHGQIEVVDWLLDNMNLRPELCPTHTRRRCLLHHAAKFGQDGCLRLLLSKMEAAGLLLKDLTDQTGNTPAHIAAKYGNLLCLQSLVEYGLDVCSPNQYRHTPCYYADFNNHRACAGYLMVVETCATLALQHVTQAAHAQWLQTRNDAVSAFTTEALTLSGAIARQTSDDVDVTYRLQQTLDDSMDLVGDMAAQLNHLYELTCELQAGMKPTDGRHLHSPGKDDLRVSMERATELQRRLEELDAAVSHQRARQQLVKVKDVQRRWEGVLQTPHPMEEEKDMQEQAKRLNRKLFSEAIQRLLVYRTNDRSSRQMTPYSTTTPSDEGAPLAIGSLQVPSLSFSSRQEQSHPDTLRKLSPRARTEVPPLIPNAPRGYTRPQTKPVAVRNISSLSTSTKNSTLSFGRYDQDQAGFGKSLNAKLMSELGLTELACGAASGSSSKDGSFTSNEDSDISSISNSQRVKNNVVESFLKSRVFYEQDSISVPSLNPNHHHPNWPTNSLFYSGQCPTQNTQLKNTDPPGLQLSEFSAFNRVANRPDSKGSLMLPSSFGVESTTEESTRRYGHSSFLSGTPSKQGKPVDRSEENRRKSQCELANGYPVNQINNSQLLNVKSNEQKKQTDENSNNRKQFVNKVVAQLKDDTSTISPQGTNSNSNNLAITGLKEKSYSEEAISEPTIPPPPQPPPPIPTKPKFTTINTPTLRDPSTLRDNSASGDQPSSHDQLSSCDHSTTSSSDQNATTGEEDTEDDCDLSGLDLGPELDGEDLMLGPTLYLDDEVEELDDHEEYVDNIFSPEELLAMAPNGRLPLSMQFETSLSTIEEVSVVSDSTRADDSITDIESVNQGENGSDSDDTVTQPSDHEENSLNPRDPTANISSSSPILPAPALPDDDDRPWYETSDDDDGSHSSPAGRRLTRLPERTEHFTLF